MKAGLAFWAGVIGAAAIVLVLAISRAVGGTGFNLGHWVGSMFTGTTTAGSWALGFVITLILGGLIALIYAAFFEAVRRSNWELGLAGGIVHLIVAGIAVGAISAVHPSIPEAVADPGYFTANYGTSSIIAFALAHLVFGIVVGSIYKPLHKRIVRREELTADERAAVGAGHERYGREREHVPTGPEESRRQRRL